MKSNTKVLLAFMALFFSMLACSVFSSGPGGVAQKFFRAVEKGEIQEAKSYMSASTLQSLGSDKWDALLTQMNQEIINKGGIDKIDVTDENVTGDLASVTVMLSFGDGTQESSTIDMIKENNKWKLQMNASIK